MPFANIISKEYTLDNDELIKTLMVLWNDIDPATVLRKNAPLLAHYTSVDALEKIIQSKEVWLSNPLNMNDYEEMRFGIGLGYQAFIQNKNIVNACGTRARHSLLKDYFSAHFNTLDREYAPNTYVLCFSEQTKDDYDGLLSMWRGYGANGNGVAIVIDGKKLPISDSSALQIGKVRYETKNNRVSIVNSIVNNFAKLLKQTNPSDDQLNIAADILLDRLTRFALFHKHNGFSEEKEWRIVYFRPRDRNKRFESRLDYAIGKNGITPKLKLKFSPSPGFLDENFNIMDIVDSILLGPSISNKLAELAVNRMLEKNGYQGGKEKVKLSTTPFRPI